MSVFGRYARYYDLIYRDKDYRSESQQVVAMLRRHATGAVSILDLGCGTGTHALFLAEIGYTVHGIDSSPSMIEIATKRKAKLPRAVADRLSFQCGDMRHFRAACRVDAVLSLFHVMSYQTTDADIEAAIETAAAHLANRGVFIFDFWYGPGVLHQEPEERLRHFEDTNFTVTRRAKPTMHRADNRISVAYEVVATPKGSGHAECIHEIHDMRYLFPDELQAMLAAHGMRMNTLTRWGSEQPPGVADWSACIVAQKAPS